MIRKNAKLVLIEIGPDNVDEHLIKCRSNRAKTKRHVNTWIRLIKKGLFRDEGLIFADKKGFYHDAQHRLQALKITGHTATFWIIEGLDREGLDMMVDSGKKRSNTARLMAAGVMNAGLVNSSIEEIIDLKEHWRRHLEMLMPDEVFAYLGTHKDLTNLAAAWSGSGITDINKKYLVALQHITSEIDAEKSDQFFSAISHRNLVGDGHPVHAFYQMLSSETLVTEENSGRKNQYVKNGLIIAWNAFYRGESLDHITPTERPITLEGTQVVEEENFRSEHEGEDEAAEPEAEESE